LSTTVAEVLAKRHSTAEESGGVAAKIALWRMFAPHACSRSMPESKPDALAKRPPSFAKTKLLRTIPP
jgi:hypothetical protein